MTGALPELDPGRAIVSPPWERKFPVIVDASVLLKDVKATYRGRETALLGLAEHGYARLISTDRVREEVRRGFARLFGADEADGASLWLQRYQPRIRWVPTPALTTVDHPELHRRIDTLVQHDATDAPTAELAVLCAPCLLVTADTHFFDAGFGNREWVETLIALGELTDWDGGLFGMTRLTWLSGWGAAASIRAVVHSKVFLPAAVVGLTYLALWERQTAGARSAGRRALRALGEFTAQALDERNRRYDRLVRYLEIPLEVPSVRSALARRLATASGPIPAYQLVATLASLGFTEREVLAGLRDDPLFSGWPGQGWTLGRHLVTGDR